MECDTKWLKAGVKDHDGARVRNYVLTVERYLLPKSTNGRGTVRGVGDDTGTRQETQ